MKKLLSAILVLVLTVGLLGTGALAAEPNGYDTLDGHFDSSYNVDIRLNGGEVNHKYSVDIDYPSAMVFTYSKDNTVWNPKTYTYDSTGEITSSGWSSGYTFTVTNHSDLPIHYAASVSGLTDDYGDLNLILSNGSGNIAACQPGDALGMRKAVFTVNISGTPNNALTSDGVKLGQVDIDITEP